MEKKTTTHKSDDDEGNTQVTRLLSVCTFNVLATTYASPKSFYHCDPKYLSWSYRKHLIFDTLRTLDADIFLLQEVDQVDDFKSFLNDNTYSVAFFKRSHNKNDGCLTAWKRNRFDLISPIYITDYNHLIHNEKNKHFEIVFTKDNIALIIVLQSKQNNTKYIVANTHLHWNPNLDYVKLWQTAALLNSVQYVIDKHCSKQQDDYKLIIGGDLNSTPHSNVYKFIINGHIHTKYIQIPSADDTHIQNDANNIKFIMDNSRNLWLQWLGIDVITFPQNTATKQYKQLFEIARQQNRIILTQNSKLTSRAECPQHLLLDHTLTLRQCFDVIIEHFNINLDDYHDTIKQNVVCPKCAIQMEVQYDEWQWFKCNKCDFAQFDAVKHFYEHCDNLIKLRNNIQKNKDDDVLDEKQCEIYNGDCNNVKVMLDYLYRAECIALRWIGIDAVYIPFKHAMDRHEDIFNLAKKEQRIIITSDKALTMMIGCPKYVYLDSKSINYRSKIVETVVTHFGIKFDEDLKVEYMQNIANNLLCSKCIHALRLVKMTLRDIDKSKIARKVLKQLKQKYHKNILLEFYQCTKCQYLPYLNVDDLIEQLYIRLQYKFEKKVHRNKKIVNILMKGFEIIPHNKQIFPALNASELKHSLGALKSVYSTIYGKEPETTNHRKEFSGCLDYIFVCSNTNIVRTNTVLDQHQLDFLPNKTHGSDHLPLKTFIC